MPPIPIPIHPTNQLGVDFFRPCPTNSLNSTIMKRDKEDIFRAYRDEFVHDDCALLLLHHRTDGTPATILDRADCRCSSAWSDREAFREEITVDVVLRVNNRGVGVKRGGGGRGRVREVDGNETKRNAPGTRCTSYLPQSQQFSRQSSR